MSLPHGGVGGLNIDIIDSQNSGLQLFSRPEVDVSLLHGSDVEVGILKYRIIAKTRLVLYSFSTTKLLVLYSKKLLV